VKNKPFIITKRDFLRVAGTGLGAGVAAGVMPFRPQPARAALSGTVNLVTWPNYAVQENLDSFSAKTGVKVNVIVGSSTGEFQAKMQIGSTGWDVLVANNLSVPVFKQLNLIQEIDTKRLPNFDIGSVGKRYMGPGLVEGKVCGIPKDWGTSGFVVNSEKAQAPTSWKEFFDLAMGPLSGRVIIPDEQLSAIGCALKYFGYPFGSVDAKQLADAEKLLMQVKPHLFAINTDYQPPMRNGDAWLAAAWSGDAMQLNRDNKKMVYGFGKEGNEIWGDYYMIPQDTQNPDAAYALLDFLLTPENNKKEIVFTGYASTDSRTDALLPKEILDNPIIYPPSTVPFEFNTSAAMIDAGRAEIYARFKAA
jgi:spermidine/putrescine transport system substrate-binding protein